MSCMCMPCKLCAFWHHVHITKRQRHAAYYCQDCSRSAVLEASDTRLACLLVIGMKSSVKQLSLQKGMRRLQYWLSGKTSHCKHLKSCAGFRP